MPITINKSERPDLLRKDIAAFQSLLDADPNDESAARMLAKRQAQLDALMKGNQ